MASIKYSNVYLNDAFSVAGPVEKRGQISKYDLTLEDYYYEEETFEKAEIKMQRAVVDNLLIRNQLSPGKIDFMIGGDLSNQIAVTTHAQRNYAIPFIGVYSACAIFVESMIIASNLVNTKAAKKAIAITSSHNLVAEKQFRYPIEYGAPKPERSTFTATGSVGALITNQPSRIKVESATIGKIVDLGVEDVFNMGAVMAPAVVDTLLTHLTELKRDVNYYDLILTGDLGKVGVDILQEYLFRTKNIKLKKHMDAGCELYKPEQDLKSGASGPVAQPLVLFNKVLMQKKYKKILVIGTGSLHSPASVNQKNTIPAIAHAVSLEVI